MISREAFISSLQDKTVIEIDKTTKFIEDTIKHTFNSIQSQLIEKIKLDVKDELIKKIGSSDKEIDASLKITNPPYKPPLKPDEFVIGASGYSRYYNDRENQFHIVYTNHNNVYNSQNSQYPKINTKSIKLSKPLIIIVRNIFSGIGQLSAHIYRSNGYSDNSVSDSAISFLTKILPDTIYQIQEKYFGDNNYGIYGCKFEEIIDDYHKLQKEMQIKNTALENSKKDLERLYSENDRLKKELEECAKLKEILIGLKNTV